MRKLLLFTVLLSAGCSKWVNHNGKTAAFRAGDYVSDRLTGKCGMVENIYYFLADDVTYGVRYRDGHVSADLHEGELTRCTAEDAAKIPLPCP